MTRSVFGWSLPPGVSQSDVDRAFSSPNPSELQENVLALLEKAKIPQPYCDAIMDLIADAEDNMDQPDPDRLREDREDRE